MWRCSASTWFSRLILSLRARVSCVNCWLRNRFFEQVIIPLAASTNAIVLCGAVPGDDILSESFLRIFSVAQSKWSGPPPFTVLCSYGGIKKFYQNPDKKAHWREVMESSRIRT